jgi:hypothetical protein
VNVNANGNASLKLADARRDTPPATGAAGEWVTKVGEAMRDAVTADDVAEIMKGLVAKAKAGDPKAIRQVLDFVGKAEAQAAPPRATVSIGVRGAGPGRPSRTVESLPVASEPALICHYCAVVLGRDGPLLLHELAPRAGYEIGEIETALTQADLGQFDHDDVGRWRLTSIGRKEFLGNRSCR